MSIWTDLKKVYFQKAGYMCSYCALTYHLVFDNIIMILFHLLFELRCLRSPHTDCFVPQGELGEPGQKGSKGDKGEHVSFLCLFSGLSDSKL